MILLLYYLFTLPLTFRTISTAFSSSLIDFTYYLKSATDLLHGVNPYTNLLYPPASLFLFIPLTLLPFGVSKIIWTVLSLASLFVGIYILVKELKLSSFNLKLSPINTSLVIFLFFLQTFPVKFALAQGQINFFVFLGYSLLFYFLNHDKDILSGLTLAIISILKFNPILFILYLLILRKTKSIYSFIIIFIGLNLLIDLFYPYNLNISFIQNLLFMSNNYSGYYYNQSLAALISRLIPGTFNSHLLTNIFSFFLCSTTISLFFLLQKHSIYSFCLFITTILLTSPLTWQHHLIWTIPIFLFLFAKSKSSKSKILLISTSAAFFLINLNIKNPQAISPQNPLYSHGTLGLLILYGILLIYSLSSVSDD